MTRCTSRTWVPGGRWVGEFGQLVETDGALAGSQRDGAHGGQSSTVKTLPARTVPAASMSADGQEPVPFPVSDLRGSGPSAAASSSSGFS